MILLAEDFLLFELPNGSSVPLRPEMIRFEVPETANTVLDADTVNQAAAAVFHYFKHELKLSSISLGEFTLALAKVLRELEVAAAAADSTDNKFTRVESDLGKIAGAVDGVELLFFAELRKALRAHLSKSPVTLHFKGLRDCVKRLSGSQRWTNRCQALSDQIVAFMRRCLEAEAGERTCTMIVE